MSSLNLRATSTENTKYTQPGGRGGFNHVIRKHLVAGCASRDARVEYDVLY